MIITQINATTLLMQEAINEKVRTTTLVKNTDTDDWEKLNGEVVDLTAETVTWLTQGEKDAIESAEAAAIAAAQAKQTERQSKLNAFTFKNVSCSVNESDQNGWETVNARVKRLVASGEAWRDFPFFMDNGNYVLIESEAEWDAFVEAGWQAREAIMMARLSS